jgi:endonuclease YncB( thermonuclease family)
MSLPKKWTVMTWSSSMLNDRWRGVASLALLVLSGCSSAMAQQTISVHDGDTLTINGQRWRLWGVDAPELDQVCDLAGQREQCGKAARDALMMLVRNEEVDCERLGASYDRAVGRCWAGDHRADLSAEMVTNGWALNWDKYSHGTYTAEEQEARRNQRGIWATRFVVPWEYRAGRR